jgi:PAS domain S-box-containing protein
MYQDSENSGIANPEGPLNSYTGRARELRILVLEDNPNDAELMLLELRKGGVAHVARCVSAREDFLAALAEFGPDLILSDHNLPGFTGIEAMALAQQQLPDAPFILVTGALGEEKAVETIKRGATDYILKDRLFQLVPAVVRAVRGREERRQRRQAEEALKKAEANYRSIYENAIEGIFQTTPEGRFLSANPALARMLGYASAEEMIESIKDISQQVCLRPESRLELKRRLEADGYVQGFENQICCKDGGKKWVSINARTVRDAQGRVSYYEGTSQDITERKRGEQTLCESEERFRQLTENIREVFWMTDPAKNEMVYISPGYEEVWGRTCEGLYASPRNWLDAIHPDDRERVLEAALTKQVSGEYDEVYRIVRPDGSIRWIQDRAFPVRNAAGEVYRIAGIAEDITREKRAEARLATLAQAVESTAEMICITDLQDRFTFVNRAFQTIYGYTEAEILGKTPEILFSPRNPPSLMAEIMEQTRLGGWRGEVFDRRKDGTEFPIFLSTSLLKDWTGQVIGLMGVAQDITERKRAEEQIRLLAEAVQSTHEMICITDHENHFTFANEAFLRTYGYTREEILGRKPDFLYSAENPKDLCEQVFRQTLRGGWQGELMNRRKDGTEFSVSLSTSQIKSNDGRRIALVGVARDISERKRAEKQNAAFALLGYRLSAAAAPDQAANIIMAIASDLFGWDAGYVHLYSRAEDRIVPVLTIDTVAGRRAPIPATSFTLNPSPLMRLIMSKGAQLINRGKDGSAAVNRVPFGDSNRPSASSMYVPIRSGGAVLGILSIQSYTPGAYSEDDLKLLQTLADHCGDALQRIKVAEALREAEAKYRSIFENATEGIFQTTPEGRYLSANPALARMFGYQSPQEFISSITNIEQQTYVMPERREELKRLLETEGFVKEFEAERYRKDRSRFWISINGHVIRGANGAVLYYEGTNQDITERKLAEEEFRRLSRRIIEAQEAERLRVARELHDGVNQTIASAKMRLGKVADALPALSPAAREILGRCGLLLGQALEENRRIAHNLRPSDLDELGLATACRNFCLQLRSRTNLAVKSNITRFVQRLPPAVELNLFRIVQEALNNVEKHARAKSVRVRIAWQGDSIVLNVQDDGRGFGPKRRRAGKGKFGGIGLMNLRERAAALGGTCEVKSVPNQGTTVTVRVPCKKVG